MNVLEALSAAGWYVDRRYAAKYGERTLNLTMEVTGLALATKLEKMLGPSLALRIALPIAVLRYKLSERNIDVERFKKFEGLFAPLIGTLGIMIGVAATTFDADMARKYLNAVRILRAFPAHHVLAVIYDYARYYTYASEGRMAEARPIGLRVLEWFQGERAGDAVGIDGVKALAGGQMTGIGLYAAITGTDEALEWACRLERIGLSFYSLMATQVRFVYHVMRGEIGRAARYREQLELNAIQGGTTWQTSILIPAMLGICSSLTGEVVRLRQATEELELVAKEIPSIAPLANSLRASYHHWRGRPEEALPLIEGVTADLRPNEHQFWTQSHGILARVLLALGRAPDAHAACTEKLRHHSVAATKDGVLHLELHLAMALAEAEGGDHDAAAARLEALLAEHEPLGVPICLALLHEARARVALMFDDIAGFKKHLQAMGRHVRATENGALIAKWQQLDSEGQIHFEERETVSRLVALNPAEAHVSVIRTLTDEHRGLARARVALRAILESADAARGYLYLGSPPDLRLVAEYPEGCPPSRSISERVVSLPSGDGVSSCDGVTAQLLTLRESGVTKIVGAVVIEASGEPGLSDELLEAIAHTLSAGSVPPFDVDHFAGGERTA